MPTSAVGADFFLQQRRIDTVLHGHQQAVVSEMRQDGVQGVGRVVGTHGDEAGVELAANLIKLVGINDLYFDVERAVGDFDLQAFVADRADMFFVDVDEGDVRAGARQPAAEVMPPMGPVPMTIMRICKIPPLRILAVVQIFNDRLAVNREIR